MIKAVIISCWQEKERKLGRKLTAREASEMSGIHRNTINAYLRGPIANPDSKVVDKFCEFFDISPGPIPFLIYERD